MNDREKNYNEMVRFVKQIRTAFHAHGDNDLNDIPVVDVIEWADQILKKIQNENRGMVK